MTPLTMTITENGSDKENDNDNDYNTNSDYSTWTTNIDNAGRRQNQAPILVLFSWIMNIPVIIVMCNYEMIYGLLLWQFIVHGELHLISLMSN